jgi:heme exporter protein D
MTWSEFFSMGGYALYVWGSYVAALVLMGGEVILLRQRKKSLTAQRDQSAEGETYENKA